MFTTALWATWCFGVNEPLFAVYLYWNVGNERIADTKGDSSHNRLSQARAQIKGDEAQGQNREAQRLRSFNGSVYAQIVDKRDVQSSEDSTGEQRMQQ